jgi:5'-deoxynucleotidase YfbR-like HD superfamily hydrolase
METSRENTAEYPLLFSAVKKLAGNKELLRRMDTVPRYERYFTSPGEKIWDMDERGHAINTYKIVRRLGTEDLKAGRLNQDEFDRLRVAALIHDLGEMETGDVSYDQKELIDQEAEKKAFEEKITLFFPKITDEEKILILKIYHEITQNKNQTEKLPKYFNLVERIGYLSNALEVFQKQPANVDWPWLIGNIVHHQGKHLLNYLKEFASAKRYLSENKTVIQEMVNWIDAHRAEAKNFTDEDKIIWTQICELI